MIILKWHSDCMGSRLHRYISRYLLHISTCLIITWFPPQPILKIFSPRVKQSIQSSQILLSWRYFKREEKRLRSMVVYWDKCTSSPTQYFWRCSKRGERLRSVIHWNECSSSLTLFSWRCFESKRRAHARQSGLLSRHSCRCMYKGGKNKLYRLLLCKYIV